MGNLLPKKYISNSKNDAKTKIIMGGFGIKKHAHVVICTLCAKTTECNCQSYHLCTSSEYWLKIKKKYRYKVMGNYQLVMYLQKIKTELNKRDNIF